MSGVIVRVVVLWAAVFLLLSAAERANETKTPPTFATFLVDLEKGRLREAVVRTHDNTVRVKPMAGSQYTVGYAPHYGSELVRRLERADVHYDVEPRRGSALDTLLRVLLPIALLAGFWLLVLRRSTSAGDQVNTLGRAPTRQPAEDVPGTVFDDVAGADEAVAELREITELLDDPSRYMALGARVPRGVLLYGPPGTGKTLLARAVAGEAGVPFFSIAGSDFVEMLVGVGAARVRDLFERAKQQAPAIVFVDEIDAVGRQRGAGIGGGHDEREQTLNQLLVEMDGFEPSDLVIVIGATNRPDILDPALLRPGRFDRQIAVEAPDRDGRLAVLQVHARDKPLASDVDLDAVAGQTAGLTGADLANVVNEAALLSARLGRIRIGQPELEEAIMRVIGGPERRSRVVSPRERWVTAVHEMGHAIVAQHVEHADPVHRISIVSRGRALGHTISLPSEDKALTTEAQLMDTIAVALGGRAAEEMLLDEVTTAAANDLEKVTATARQMVMRFGMSQKLGARVFGADDSAGIARDIDSEIRRIVQAAYDRAKAILLEREVLLRRMSEILLERETIEGEEFTTLLFDRGEVPSTRLPIASTVSGAAFPGWMTRAARVDDDAGLR